MVKNFFVKNVFLPSFSDIQKKCVGFFENFSVNLAELHLTSPKDHCEDITLFLTKCFLFFFHVFHKMNGEISVFPVKKQSANLSQLLTTCPRRLFEEFFFEKFLFFVIGHWSIFACHFDKNLLVPLSVLLSVCLLDKIVVKKSNKFFSHRLRTLIANWSVLFRFFFGQVDDTEFYESKGSFWGYKTVLKNICLFHLSFADNERINQGFFGKQSAGLSKLLTTCPRGSIQEVFLEKRSFSISSFGFERAFLVLCTNFCGSGCQYCFLCVN